MAWTKRTALNSNWKFIVYFICYIFLFLFLGQIPLSFLQDFKIFTAYAVALFWKAFSVPVVNSDIYVTFFEFRMEITLECTGLHYLIIFLAGILAYPSRSLYYKLAGIFIGTFAILFLNILRIGILGIIAHHFSSLFDFIHIYLWQGTFAFFVLLIWILWVNGKSGISRIFMRYVILSLFVASISFELIILFMDYYAAFLAISADAVFSLLSPANGLPIAAVAEGKLIGYVSQKGTIYNNISIDVINSVLFFTLAVVTASLSQYRLFLKRILAGIGLLFLQHLLYVIMYGVILVNGMDADSFAILLWFTRGFSIVTPLLVWLFVTLLFRPAN